MNPVFSQDSFDQVQVQLRLGNHALHVYPSLVLLLEDNVWRGFIKTDPKSFQLLFKDLLVSQGLEDVQNDKDQVCCPSHSNNLPSSSLSVLSTFNNPRQVKKLDLGTLHNKQLIIRLL